ncbi:hypothetical protein OAG29_01465 [Planctomycetaceae bacterium]|nr:hypothetical protein [Planctomycetaceae bacterium]
MILFGEIQYLSLKPQAAENEFDRDVTSQAGARYIFGAENCEGLGVRFRYLDYDGAHEAGGETNGLALQAIDLEITQSFTLGHFDGVISGGYRNGKYTSEEDGNRDVVYEGNGITLGLMLERDINRYFGLYGWVQKSYLFGNDSASSDDNAPLDWTEAQLGLTITPVDHFFVRGGAEIQHHSGLLDDDTSDSALVGWFLSGGIAY